jgi:hypothetical protein
LFEIRNREKNTGIGLREATGVIARVAQHPQANQCMHAEDSTLYELLTRRSDDSRQCWSRACVGQAPGDATCFATRTSKLLLVTASQRELEGVTGRGRQGRKEIIRHGQGTVPVRNASAPYVHRHAVLQAPYVRVDSQVFEKPMNKSQETFVHFQLLTNTCF